MKFSLTFLLILAFAATSCRKDPVVINQDYYHIIIVCGQSNTYYGDGYDPAIDGPHPQIFQFGRQMENDYKIIEATQPLDHHTPRIPGTIGFPMTFAKLYVDAYMLPHEKLLIIPCAKAGSAFTSNHWNRGNKLYNDLVERVNHVMSEFPASHLAAILWHQGESDINNSHYRADLDAFIPNLRYSINAENTPFILGGMNPNWVNKDADRVALQDIIKDTPNRHSNTGYVDPELPELIETINSIHYNAPEQRALGRRYFSIYQTLR